MAIALLTESSSAGGLVQELVCGCQRLRSPVPEWRMGVNHKPVPQESRVPFSQWRIGVNYTRFSRNRTTAFSFWAAMHRDESGAWEMAVH